MVRRTHSALVPAPGLHAGPSGNPLESPRFLDFADGQIYTVTHAALRPRRASVLLCGPFGIERERSYLTHVLWARTLAARGFEVMRFDYRGHGESTGSFEEMTIRRWREDAAFCASRLSAATRRDALVLQGTRLGALIAADLFASGIGDGLLLWEPPASAEAHLRDTLRHHLVAQRLSEPDRPPRLREQLIADLEAGEHVVVDGYSWTRGLWRDAQRHPLILPSSHETRPWLVLNAANVGADTFWKSSSPLLVPRSEGFFHESLEWLDACEPWCARRS